MWLRSRQFGLGFNHNDVVQGMGAIGVAICDSIGQPVAAVAVAGPIGEWGDKQLALCMDYMRTEAKRIEQESSALISEISE